MKNPFETGHIKNYLLLYAGVVVIMILFFAASTIFIQNKEIEKKSFNTQMKQMPDATKQVQEKEEEPSLTSKIKLMEKRY